MNGLLSVCSRRCGEWDAVAAGNRSQGRNVDLKFVIITIKRRNNDNNNNSNSDNINSVKIVVIIIQTIIITIHSMWLAHKVWYTTNEHRWYSNTRHNKHSELWSREKVTTRRSKQTSSINSIKNETFRTTGQKAHWAWSTLLKMI